MSEHLPQLFADRIEICELTAAYNRRFDRGDGPAWAETFITDGELVVAGDRAYTGNQLVDFCAERTGRFHHLTTDPEISVDGDRAVQRCSLLLLSTAGERPELVAAGRYVDELRRTSGGWRFTRRTVTMTRAPERSSL